MTIPRLEAMTRYWESSPPTHIMLASFFEAGKKKPKSVSKDEAQPFGDIFKELPI